MNLPVEALEMEAPLRVLRSHLAPGSGGPGRFRGGLGLEREYEVLADELTLTYRGERHFSAARGLARGGDGAPASAIIARAGGGEEAIPSKTVTRLHRGDRLTVRTAGGAGWGDPGSRDPDAVREDLAGGKVAG